jgi:hypothetical protein
VHAHRDETMYRFCVDSASDWERPLCTRTIPDRFRVCLLNLTTQHQMASRARLARRDPRSPHHYVLDNFHTKYKWVSLGPKFVIIIIVMCAWIYVCELIIITRCHFHYFIIMTKGAYFYYFCILFKLTSAMIFNL